MRFLPSVVQKLSSEQAHRQSDRQRDRQMDRHIDRQTQRQTDSTEILGKNKMYKNAFQ